MNILKIKNQKSGGTLALFEKDSYLSVSESVSEKAKLIRGDPPKIALKRRGSPLKIKIKIFGCQGVRLGTHVHLS
jgi:hypothetical protein